jgi:hypothetical protein
MNTAQSAARDKGMPPAGVIGRGGKLIVGAIQLLFVYSVASHASSIMRAPPASLGFWVMVVLAVWLIPLVANLGFIRERSFGSRVQWVVVAVFLVLAGAGWRVSATWWWPPAAAWVSAVAIAIHGYVGVCHLASAVLGFPGCEVRALAYVVGRGRGVGSVFAPCPGFWTPLDRWEARMRHRA